MDLVVESEFFQGNGNLPAIRGGGGVEIDHGETSVGDDNLHVLPPPSSRQSVCASTVPCMAIFVSGKVESVRGRTSTWETNEGFANGTNRGRGRVHHGRCERHGSRDGAGIFAGRDARGHRRYPAGCG